LTPKEQHTVSAAVGAALSDTKQRDLPVVLSRAHVGILHRDLQRRVLVVNDAFCALVGRSKKELNGLPFELFTHPDDAERSRLTYERQFAKAEPFEIEKRYVRPDGTNVYCAVHVSFVLDESGAPESTITVASDITARHRAECELRETEQHYRYAVELNPQIAWTAAPDGAINSVSPRWQALTGVPVSKALGDGWMAVLHPNDVVSTQAVWATSVATKQPVDVEYRVKTVSGTYRWFRARATARLDEAGNIVLWYGTLEDIDDRRVAEDALRDSEERFRLAAEAAGLGIWDYDATRDRREWSPHFKAMLGLGEDVEPSVVTALELVVPADRALLKALVDAARAGDGSHRFEVALRVRRANDGAERWMQTGGWRIHASSGRLTRVLVTIRDVTEERTAEELLRWTATHDSLTRIANRACFTEQAEAAITGTADGSNLALVLLDVDHLKDTNDTFGHDAGDAILKTFAARLSIAFDIKAIVGRLGGDEFAVLLEVPVGNDVVRKVDDALKLLREPFDYEGHACNPQATAGVSLFPTDGSNAADLLKAADIALYVGKHGQRGSVSLFHPSMRAGMQRRVSMLNVARMAVRERRIIPFYQPKVVLADGSLAGFEALLRWRHDSLGIQTPDTVAAAFEDVNLATALSDTMIEGVARDLRKWLDRGFEPGRIAINLSPAEFRQDQLADRVLEPFDRLNIPLDHLELEITETVLLARDAERVSNTLARFHQAGVKIALDDFGTGYASLTHLKEFPVDVIKIDRGFVGNLYEGSDDAAIVEAIIGLARGMGMEVVAEGIEEERQARFLTERGCTFGQGYLFSRPLPADAVTTILEAAA
jgi:diguanylate cyclase (GGDEF)-like protein/PAS domain S-box-containing protein